MATPNTPAYSRALEQETLQLRKLLAETQDIEKANQIRQRLGMPLLPTGPEQRKALQSDIANILRNKVASDLVPLTPQFDVPSAPSARNFGALLSTSGQGPEGPREFNAKELSALSASRMDQADTDYINRLYAEEAARKAGPMVPYNYTPNFELRGQGWQESATFPRKVLEGELIRDVPPDLRTAPQGRLPAPPPMPGPQALPSFVPNYTTVGEPTVLDAKRQVQDARLQQELNKLIPPAPTRDPRIITTGEAMMNLNQGLREEATKASREEAIDRRNRQKAAELKVPLAESPTTSGKLSSLAASAKEALGSLLPKFGTKGKVAAGALGVGAAGTAGYFMLPDGSLAPQPSPAGTAPLPSTQSPAQPASQPASQPDASNVQFFGQPSTPSAPADPELQRLQSLADKRSGGTIWSRDENGNLQATDAFNAPDERLSTLGIQRPTSAWYQQGTAAAQDPLMAQIAQAAQLDPTSPDSAQVEMALHMGMTEAMESKRAALLQETAATLNLPALEAEVTNSIARAQSNPDYVADFGQQDSDETIQAKEALHKAELQQESLVQQRLQSDPSLMSLNSFLTQTLQSREQQRMAAGRQEAKVQEFGKGVNLVGAVLNDGPAPPALINQNAGKYSELYARMSNPDEFLQAALDTKIPEARKLAPAAYAMKVSGSQDPTSPIFKSAQEESEARLRLLESYTSTGANLEETFKQSNLPIENLSAYTKAKKMAETAPDAGNLKALEAARFQVATALVSTQIRNTFEGKVQTWKYPGDNGEFVSPFADSSTPLGKLYATASASKPGAPVAISDLSTALRSMPPDEQVLAKKAFEDAAAKTLAYSGQLPFGGALSTLSPKSLSDRMVAGSVVKEFNKLYPQATMPVGDLGGALAATLFGTNK